jgi:hypothetical protein
MPGLLLIAEVVSGRNSSEEEREGVERDIAAAASGCESPFVLLTHERELDDGTRATAYYTSAPCVRERFRESTPRPAPVDPGPDPAVALPRLVRQGMQRVRDYVHGASMTDHLLVWGTEDPTGTHPLLAIRLGTSQLLLRMSDSELARCGAQRCSQWDLRHFISRALQRQLDSSRRRAGNR